MISRGEKNWKAKGRKIKIFCGCRGRENFFCVKHTILPVLLGVKKSIAPAEILQSLEGMGCTRHSPRRSLAVAIRIRPESEKVEPTISVLQRINCIFGWSQKSGEFWHYSRDYHLHLNRNFPPLGELYEFIARG